MYSLVKRNSQNLAPDASGVVPVVTVVVVTGILTIALVVTTDKSITECLARSIPIEVRTLRTVTLTTSRVAGTSAQALLIAPVKFVIVVAVVAITSVVVDAVVVTTIAIPAIVIARIAVTTVVVASAVEPIVTTVSLAPATIVIVVTTPILVAAPTPIFLILVLIILCLGS